MREKLLALRRQVPPNDRIIKARSLTAIVTQLSSYQSAKNIAIYWSTTEEINTQPLIQAIHDASKNCYLPLLNNNILIFQRVKSATTLQVNKYNIYEPKPAPHQQITLANLDIVFLPLVGFDNNKYRLGMGGGYFDRTFSFIKKENLAKPLLIGLSYAIQQVAVLPTDTWDLQLDAVVTEQSYLQ